MSLDPRPEITYWVGFSHQTDHYILEQELELWSQRTGVRIEPAYDGLQIPLLYPYGEQNGYKTGKQDHKTR